jgi:cytochrome bd-type quinol oxidase subunit 1
MLSGMSKAGTRLHVRATSMVATGAVSAFRILSVHARVRTLQGCATDAAGQVVPADGL